MMEICPSCFGTSQACRVCGGVGTVGPTSRPLLRFAVRRADTGAFGTADCPLRMSSLDGLCRCPWRATIMHMFDVRDEAGPAADTGSAVHAAVAAWHREGLDAAAAIRSMVERHGEFPLANLDEAAALFLLYSRDPRNLEARIVLLEETLSFSMPPAPEDVTGQPVCFVGRVDQVRLVDREYRVYDVKTSKRPGRVLMDEHMKQICAYAVGASLKLGAPVKPGGLIVPRGYVGKLPESKPDGVFFDLPWTFEDCRHVLWGIRRVVAAVRAGEVWNVGGDHCRYCPAGSTDECVPLLRAATDPGTMRVSLPSVPPPLSPDVEIAGTVDVETLF